jgi:hypothetical protein
MFVMDQSSAEEMQFVNPIITVLSVLVRKDILATLRMTKLDAKRNSVPQIQTVLMRVSVWTTDVSLLQDQVVILTETALQQKIVLTETVFILVTTLQLVESMLDVTFTNIKNSVLVLKVSLVTLKLSVFACPTLVFPIKDVLVA